MPKISIVVTGRNDNYDGNFDERLSIALSKNLQALPEAEFIFVEWNPYIDRELSCQKLKKVFGNRVRYFVVHPKYHSTYCQIDGFLEYPAKNVGIRRSTGDFVLCTNSDVILCPDTVSALKADLKTKVLYRANRVDINLSYKDVQFPIPSEHILGRNTGVFNASGDFLLMDKGTWNEATGYCEEFPEQRLHKDSFLVYLLMERIHHYPVAFVGDITHWRHPSSWANGFIRPKVGDIYWDFKASDFQRNNDAWGLVSAKEVKRDGITWLS